MRKIAAIITLVMFIATTLWSSFIYLKIKKSQQQIILDIERNLSSEATNLSQIIQANEITASDLTLLTTSDELKTKLSTSIFSIAVLNLEKTFLYGWTYDEDGHVHPMPPDPNSSYITQQSGWVKIELNASLRTSNAVYIIPTAHQTFLLITYNLSSSLNSLRSLSYGYTSYAYTETSETSFKETLINPIPWHRLFNFSILIRVPVIENLTLVFTGNWADIYPYPLSIIYSFFGLILAWGILLIATTGLILHVERLNPKALWTLSFLFDFFCAILIIFLFADFPNNSSRTLEQTQSVRKIKEFFNADPSVILIPTAVYIDSLSFSNDTSFLVTGFVSQIYPKDNLMTMGFLFPYQATEYPASIKEISRWETDTSITVLWHFGVGLTAPFSTKFFPFDKRIAEITFWPKELHKNIVFFPNFLNFDTLDILQKPGFDSSINPIGWSIIDSSFILQNQSPYSFFAPAQKNSLLTYVFEIILERNFLGAFLSNILVLVLCIFVAFLVLFIPRDSLLDSLFATISIFVGLIFIAVTNHSSLRDSLQVSSFAYVEYLFISFYILLMGITVDFIARRTTPISDFDRKYLLAIYYWPALLGSFTIMLTLSIFT